MLSLRPFGASSLQHSWSVGMLLLTAGGAGCSSSLGNGCNAAIYAPPQLAIPASGATGVPVDLGEIYVTDPADGTFTMRGAGTSFRIGPVSAVPSPAPSALPTDNPPSAFHEVALPTLAAGVTYTVLYAPKPSMAQCPTEVGGTVGSFTTQ